LPDQEEIYVGEVPERPKGTDCKSVGDAFGGSNPPLSTRLLAEDGLKVFTHHTYLIDPITTSGASHLSFVFVGHSRWQLMRMQRFSICLKSEEEFRYDFSVTVFRARAGVAQLAEHQPSKLRVAGSIPVSRSIVQALY
jgi:hypothetical protein